MKAIAAVSLLQSLSAGSTAAAGIFVSSAILLFSLTGLLKWFTHAIPIPVVKGIQLGAGLSLILAACTRILSTLSWTTPSWSDNYVWVALAFFFLFLLPLRPQTPYALIVLILGITTSLTSIPHSDLPSLRPWTPITQVPSGPEWRTGIVSAGIGQLPLTTLNSIVAVTHLASDLLPSAPTPSVTAVGLSVAAMNIVGCWFGAMPVCHGSGGLAAQHRFGARSGASVIILGLVKLVLGLVFGESLKEVLDRFPIGLLGVMIVASGLELCGVGESLNTPGARDLKEGTGAWGGENGDGSDGGPLSEEERRKRWNIMLVTAGLLIGFRNDAVGFMGGMLCWFCYRVPVWAERGRGRPQADVAADERQRLLG